MIVKEKRREMIVTSIWRDFSGDWGKNLRK